MLVKVRLLDLHCLFTCFCPNLKGSYFRIIVYKKEVSISFIHLSKHQEIHCKKGKLNLFIYLFNLMTANIKPELLGTK